jgi:hypothetical protein
VRRNVAAVNRNDRAEGPGRHRAGNPSGAGPPGLRCLDRDGRRRHVESQAGRRTPVAQVSRHLQPDTGASSARARPVGRVVLPGNVVLEPADGGTRVRIIDPHQLMDDARVATLAEEASVRLRAAMRKLRTDGPETAHDATRDGLVAGGDVPVAAIVAHPDDEKLRTWRPSRRRSRRRDARYGSCASPMARRASTLTSALGPVRTRRCSSCSNRDT